MKIHSKYWGVTPRLIFSFVLSLVGIACDQYDYSSPSPGILEVRLRLANSRTDIVPFSNPDSSTFSNFNLILRRIVAKQPGDVQLELFSDLYAIRRNPDGDVFNALDTVTTRAGYVLGKSYAPPQTFTRFDLRILPISAISVSSRYSFNVIEVRQPVGTTTDLVQLPAPGQAPFNVKIEEGHLTRVIITFDLDSSLVRRAEWFEYRPYFYVSSVQNF